MQFLLVSLTIIGFVFLIFAKNVGTAFCRLGKAMWKKATFGSTDMDFLYPEGKAALIFRLCGGCIILNVIIFIWIIGFPFNGRNKQKAISDAEEYLTHSYGNPHPEWSLSAKLESTDGSIVGINYSMEHHSGELRGEWSGEHYKFTEIPKK